jgi:hypothetical protein
VNKAYRNRIFVLAATAALGSAGIIVPAATATASTTAGTTAGAHPRPAVEPALTATALAQDIIGFNAKHLQGLGVKLAAEISASASATLSVKANGLLDTQLSAELDAELHAVISASTAATIEAELGPVFGESLGTRVTAILASKCPGNGPEFANCVRINTPAISQAIVNLYVQAITKISADVTAKLDAVIDASIAITIKNFEANLVLESVTVTGQASLDAHVKALVAAWVNLKPDASEWTTALAELILTAV